MTLAEEKIEWWKEHFEDLQNPTNPPSTIEADMEDDRGSSGSLTTLQWQSTRD